MLRFIKSLKFQIGLALLSLISLFFYFSLYTLSVLEEQRSYATLVRLAGELKVTYQHMAMQAMNYHENAPRDYQTYYRDLKLYYQDLMSSTKRFDAICSAFSSGRFPAKLTLVNEFMAPPLASNTRAAALKLEHFWKSYNRELQDKLGSAEEPRLEWAAEHISNASGELKKYTSGLLSALESDILYQTQNANNLLRITFIVALILTLGIMLWLYFQVLWPLGKAVQGFEKVATGNFGYKVEVGKDNEIGWLTQSFNHLSGRLDTIFGLITRLQQGSDLDDTLVYVSSTLPELLPLDWVGALIVNDEGQIQLERAYSHGKRETLPVTQFSLHGSLLQQCLNDDQPLHIPDLGATDMHNPANAFLNFLCQQHWHEAIFMPISKQSPVPVVLVFASRAPHAYQEQHLHLLSNLSLVIALSFGRTLRLVEQGRLAAIGQFASGIAHEIRNPLSTIQLALEHFQTLQLPDSAEQRRQLASTEVARMKRLLEDILHYAKPLRLNLQRIDLQALLQQLLLSLRESAVNTGVELTLIDAEFPAKVLADRDRLTQVLINLLNNALDAAPTGTKIGIAVTTVASGQEYLINIHNQGIPITAEHQQKLFEPFFTTKASGTGLGLSIARRMIVAMGGSIAVNSSIEAGTVFSIRIPAVTLPLH